MSQHWGVNAGEGFTYSCCWRFWRSWRRKAVAADSKRMALLVYVSVCVVVYVYICTLCLLACVQGRGVLVSVCVFDPITSALLLLHREKPGTKCGLLCVCVCGKRWKYISHASRVKAYVGW